MRLLSVYLPFSFLFLSPVLSQDLIQRLNELGLDAFADSLQANNPDIVESISKRNDITVWAPGNEAVARDLAQARLAKRATGDKNPAHINQDPEPPRDGGRMGNPRRKPNNGKKKRNPQGPRDYPDTNFQRIFTLLNDTEYVNLGPGGQVARFVRNYASPRDGDVDSPPVTEVTSGLGQVQSTLRGPFKFKNGVIYEVTDFFTLPAPFSDTMEYVNKSQIFLNSIVATENEATFEDTPAITIFAPIDEFVDDSCDFNPESYILWADDEYAAFLSPDLIPGQNLTSYSGDIIEITRAENGEKLVNGRRLVQPNVVIKNGVIHFIDGPLHGENCNVNCTDYTSY